METGRLHTIAAGAHVVPVVVVICHAEVSAVLVG